MVDASKTKLRTPAKGSAPLGTVSLVLDEFSLVDHVAARQRGGPAASGPSAQPAPGPSTPRPAHADALSPAVRLRLDAALRAVSVDIRRKLIDMVSYILWAVDEGGFDHVVVIARRMACVYKLALACGLAHRPRIISDRFIDALPDDAWEGERVLIADDTCISGETMRHRVPKVRRLIGARGVIEKGWAIKLRQDRPTDMARAKSLQPQLAESFSTAIVPYFTDFVVSNEFYTTDDYMSELLENPAAWKTVDMTNAFVAGSTASSVSLFVLGDGALGQSFKARLGPAAELISVAKLRLFLERSGGRTRCRLVPIVLTRRLPVAALFDWLRSESPPLRKLAVPSPLWTIADSETPERAAMSRAFDEETPESELAAVAAGLLTVAFSQILFDAFIDYLDQSLKPRLLPGSPPITVDREHMEFISGRLISVIAALAQTPGRLDLISTPSADDTEFREPGFWQQGLELDPRDSGWFYQVGEDVVESAYLQLDAAAERLTRADWENKLRPPPIPLAILALESDRNEITSSIAIDLLNDLGVAVPEWRSAKGFVFRCLGHAEAFGPYNQIPRGRLGGRIASLPRTVCLGRTEA
ncbi:MAG: phosphoribosyltransferase [Propionibacteriaceae bacterium]|jgi:hypothetical protein|nr:phosphoribosyltransferase [Propionibacteriaceae bacterium]